MTRLGEHTVGLRTKVGTGVRDRYGVEQTTTVDVEIPGCLVTPVAAATTAESPDRSAPMVTGMQILAPPGTGLDAADAIVWPIIGRGEPAGVLTLTGRVWQVDGEVGDWDDFVQARLRKAT